MTEEDYQRIKRNYDEDEKVEKQKEEEMFKKLVMQEIQQKNEMNT